MKRIAIVLSFAFVAVNLYAQNESDIEKAKRFIYEKAGYKLVKPFYEDTIADSPFVYLYVSQKDRVEKPKELAWPIFNFDSDFDLAVQTAATYEKRGFDTFIYKTNGNAAAKINRTFLNYELQSQAFIIFHEYIHNHLVEKQVSVPYEYTEAICDAVGNYMIVEYLRNTEYKKKAVKEVKTTESLYRDFNRLVSSINDQQKPRQHVCNRIAKRIRAGSSFQKDRFDYTINNAYLLKNHYYAAHYFVFKRILMKQKSLAAFLRIVENIPSDETEGIVYLKKFV